MATSIKTTIYWLKVFREWAEAREMPGPQTDECIAAIDELIESLSDPVCICGHAEHKHHEKYNGMTVIGCAYVDGEGLCGCTEFRKA